MKYDLTVYDIGENITKRHQVDIELESLRTGDWSCDCLRRALFRCKPKPKPEFKYCRHVGFLILCVSEVGTNKVVGDADQFNAKYNDVCRNIARKEFDRDREWNGLLNGIAKSDEDKAAAEKAVVDADKYVHGHEFEATKKILRQWDPENLAIVSLDEYDSYAKTFVSWALKCGTAREFAIQIAARFNHMTCLRLNDDGVFEIVKAQPYTADGCLHNANRIRKVCGVLDRLDLSSIGITCLPRTTVPTPWHS